MRINTQWFTTRLADKQMSQRSMAKLIGLDPAAVSLLLRGKRKMTVEEAGQIADLLGVHVDEVLRHAGVRLTSRSQPAEGRVPVVGWIDGRGFVHDDKAKGPSVVEAPPSGEDCIAFRMQTDGAFDGWVCYYRQIEGVSLEVLDRMCIVELENGQKLLRAVKRGYEPGFFTIGGWGEERSDNVRLVTASPVLWMRQ